MSKSALLLLLIVSLSAAQTTYYFESILQSFYVDCEHGGEGHDFGNNIEHFQVTRSVNNPKNNNASLIEEFNEVPF